MIIPNKALHNCPQQLSMDLCRYRQIFSQARQNHRRLFHRNKFVVFEAGLWFCCYCCCKTISNTNAYKLHCVQSKIIFYHIVVYGANKTTFADKASI
jgi:hypothetical protein